MLLSHIVALVLIRFCRSGHRFCVSGYVGRMAVFFNPGDQTGGPVEREIIPGPLDEDQEAVAETDEVHQVDDEPHHPGDEAAEMEFAEVGDCGRAADGGHVTEVAVAEGRQWAAA